MQTNNERPISRVCMCAIPLNNNEILTFGEYQQRSHNESLFVEKNSNTLSNLSFPALLGCKIYQAVCISDNKVVAEVGSPS